MSAVRSHLFGVHLPVLTRPRMPTFRSVVVRSRVHQSTVQLPEKHAGLADAAGAAAKATPPPKMAAAADSEAINRRMRISSPFYGHVNFLACLYVFTTLPMSVMVLR